MQANQPGERKKKPFLWILAVVAVLLIGVIGIYSRYMWMHPPQVRTPVVARGKISAPPPSPALESGPDPSTAAASEPPAEARSPEDNSGALGQGDPESTPDASVEADPQESAPEMNAEVAAAPEDDATDSRSAPLDDAEQTGAAAGSSGDQASAPDAGDTRPTAIVAEESRAASKEIPAVTPSPDTVPPAPPEPPAARTETASAPESPDVAETPAPFAVQVGAFRTKSNADRQISRLQEKGFDAYLYEKNDKDQRAWYFVRFGRFESYGAAQRALKAYTAQEQAEGAIVRSKSD
jgi:cell division protein FtsN